MRYWLSEKDSKETIINVIRTKEIIKEVTRSMMMTIKQRISVTDRNYKNDQMEILELIQ